MPGRLELVFHNRPWHTPHARWWDSAPLGVVTMKSINGPSAVITPSGTTACSLNALPDQRWQSVQWQQ